MTKAQVHYYFMRNVAASFDEFMTAMLSPKRNMGEDRRRAGALANLLFHMREQMPHPYTKKVWQLSALCPDYAIVREVANAFKHNVLDPTKKPPPTYIASADDIKEMFTFTEYVDALGKYNVQHKDILLSCKDKKSRSLVPMLVNVYNMWIDELKMFGIDTTPHYILPPRSTARQHITGAGEMNFSSVAGEQLELAFHMTRFNYGTKSIEPVDCTNSKFEIRIYPATEHTLRAVDENGEQFDFLKMTLTAGEFTQMNSLPEDQRNDFMMEVAKTRPEFVAFAQTPQGGTLSCFGQSTDITFSIRQRYALSKLTTGAEKDRYLTQIVETHPDAIAFRDKMRNEGRDYAI